MAPWTGWLRSEAEEILDREGPQGRGLAILEDLDRWNRRSGWAARHVRAVEQHWRAQGSPSPFRVLDVGTGHGGLLEALADWGERSGAEVQLEGVDLHPIYVEMAAARVGDRARVFQADATKLPVGDRHYHLATCALMMHHLPRPVRGALVAELARVAVSAYVFDLECTAYGAAGAALVLRLAGLRADAVNDGVLSIRRGHTWAEFQELVRPLPVRPVRVFPSALATAPQRARPA